MRLLRAACQARRRRRRRHPRGAARVVGRPRRLPARRPRRRPDRRARRARSRCSRPATGRDGARSPGGARRAERTAASPRGARSSAGPGGMFRREWRQQLLVLALLTVAVTAAVGQHHDRLQRGPRRRRRVRLGQPSAARSTAPIRGKARGRARRRPAAVRDDRGHRPPLGRPCPAASSSVDVPAPGPGRPATAPRCSRCAAGSYPAGAGQVAVTDGVAELAAAATSARPWRSTGGDGRSSASSRTRASCSDEFALVSPSSAGAGPGHVLVDASAGRASPLPFPGRPCRAALRGLRRTWKRRGSNQRRETLAMFSVATVFLLLASLVAAAASQSSRSDGSGSSACSRPSARRRSTSGSCCVDERCARRGDRRRSSGRSLASRCGSSPAPTLETAVDHRIDRLSLPWGLIATAVLLAVLGRPRAAWWPGRTVSRLPVMLALSGRPPTPRPARHSAIAAAALIAVGIGSSRAVRPRPSSRSSSPASWRRSSAACSSARSRSASSPRVAGRVSIAPRLALRDLARYQARSGAALAAVTLALGIAATAVIVAASAEKAKAAAEPPKLSDRQIRVVSRAAGRSREFDPGRRARTARPSGGRRPAARRPARPRDGDPAPQGHATGRTPVFDPSAIPELLRRDRARTTIQTAQPAEGVPAPNRSSTSPRPRCSGTSESTPPRSIRARTSSPTGPSPPSELVIPSFDEPSDEVAVTNVQRIEIGEHLLGAPANDPREPTFITLDGLRRHGWKQVPAGWLVESRRPADERADRRRPRDRGAKPASRSRSTGAVAPKRRPRRIATAAGAAARARHPRADGRADPQRERRRPAHADRDRSELARPPHADGHDRRRARSPRRAPRRRRRLCRPRRDVPRRPRPPELGAGPPTCSSRSSACRSAAGAAGWLLAGREPPAIARSVIE